MKAQDFKKSMLQYAMQGKLVPQDPNDEPASFLLERIKAEKEQLIKDGKIKKENPLAPITEEEIPYEIPKNWKWCNLTDIAINIHYGYNGSANFNLKEPKLLRITDIQNNNVDWETVPACDIATRTLESYKLQNNDILIARTGGTIGKSYLIENIKYNVVFASYLIRVIPALNSYPKYIKLFIESPLYWSQLIEKSSGTGQPNVNGTSLKSLVLPLPPLEEQKRIVEKLEQILPLIDEYDKNEQKLTEINKKLPSKLRQAILQYAVEGKIIPQKPSDEPASVLIKRIKTEKEQLVNEGKIKKEKPLHPITGDEIPYALPQNWEWVRTINISQLNPRNELEDNTKVGFVPMNLISSKYGETHEFETKLWKEIKSGFTHFQDNDVVVAKITPCFQNGKSAIIKNLPNNTGAGTTELHVIRPLLVLPEFLLIHFKSPSFLNTGKQLMTGCAGQQRVPRSYIENYIIGLPPLEEQKRIVAKVDELMKLCDELEEQIKNPKLATKILEKISKELPATKKSNVIDITDAMHRRAAFRAHVISKFKNNAKFGAIQCEKLTYLPEMIFELPLGGTYEKQIAGPFDSEAKKKVDELFNELKWIKVIDGNKSQNTRYIPDENFAEYEESFNLCFVDRKTEIDNLLNLFKNKNSTECEAVATLYAVWNDLLIDKIPATQEDIIEGFYKWSDKKKNFNRSDLYETLAWMKSHNIIPTGKGKKTNPKIEQVPLFS